MTTESSERAMPAVADARTVVRLLRGVERLPQGANGALVFGTKEERWGTLLVEDRKVCWAAAKGMETRLTDIIRAQAKPPIDKEVIERVYERCRNEGTPLGAGLVARGVVTPRGLQRALRQHAGEAVLQLSQHLARQERIAPVWVPNRTRRYDAQFTFAAAEILVCVGALGRDDVSSRVHRSLELVMEDSLAAAAFLAESDEREVLPIAQAHGETVGVEGLVALGSWAMGAMRYTAPLEGERLVAASNDEHQTAVAWRSDDIVYAALCDDRTSLSVLVARRARTRGR